MHKTKGRSGQESIKTEGRFTRKKIKMNLVRLGVGDIIEKLSKADISAFLQFIGKSSLSEKIDLGIIEKLSLSKMCS